MYGYAQGQRVNKCNTGMISIEWTIHIQNPRLAASPFRAPRFRMVAQMEHITPHLELGGQEVMGWVFWVFPRRICGYILLLMLWLHDFQLTLKESKEADTAAGQATHQISRGIHDKVSDCCYLWHLKMPCHVLPLVCQLYVIFFYLEFMIHIIIMIFLLLNM